MEIVKLPEIRLAGMVTLIRDDKEIIGQLWNLFCNEIIRIESRVQPERFYGHSFWSNHYDLEGFFLMVAVEVKDFTSVPIPLCTRTIQPAKYLKFIHKGIVDNIEMTYKYIFQTYLPKTDYRLTHPYDFELYGKNFKNGREPDSETEIYIPIE
jgi:AraC family transcriptional regulator